ncbi:MAG: insulinase family protein [Alphaproteobacteria bacterium]|nr:insulinase family protein [Alphaproteobacteria bacterium]
MTSPITTLASGLRVAVDEMKDVETVSVGVFVNTGSRHETPEINGISHFLEHMAFKGTKKRSAKQIAEEFEGIGGRINAYTSKERTVYYAKVLKQHAQFAVEFLADILQNSTFDKTELEKERGVILQEIAMTNDTPDDIVFDYFQEAAYPAQPLGRSILGPVKNIKKFTREDFTNYIGKQYNYQNMAVVAAGAIKEKDLVAWSKKYFTQLGTAKIKTPQVGKYSGGEFKKEKKLEQVNLVMGFKGLSCLDPGYYTAQILAMILGGGMSSRLFQEVRENRGLAYSIYAFNYNHQDSGLFGIYAGTTPDKANELITATQSEIKKICEKISDSEMKRVKTQFEASLLMAKESTSTRMQKLGSDILVLGKIQSDREIKKEIAAVTKSDVTKLAEKIFTGSKPTFAAIGKVAGVKYC